MFLLEIDFPTYKMIALLILHNNMKFKRSAITILIVIEQVGK